MIVYWNVVNDKFENVPWFWYLFNLSLTLIFEMPVWYPMAHYSCLVYN